MPNTAPAPYVRHRPELTLLYQVIEHHLPEFTEHLRERGHFLPKFVFQEFHDYLKCGRLEHGFVRVKCTGCRNELLVVFSCKHRGFCPSCGGRRMVDTAAHLVDRVLPAIPIRQWVLSFPYPLRLLYSTHPQAMTRTLGIVLRAIETHLIRKAGLTRASGAGSGAITFIQRFGSALNLNVHLHMLIPDGVYTLSHGKPRFHAASAPSHSELTALLNRIVRRITRQLTRDGCIFYYRIQSPVVLIEFDHQLPVALSGPPGPSRDHIHTVVRTPNGNDYGRSLLQQHLAAYPHAPMASGL